jgi:S-DNA-T family DNA segregation ATPase FtsK/SpoIIIE
MSMSELPTVLPPGRGWRSGSKSEVQLAMLTEDASGQAQAETLRRIGRHAAERDAGVGAAARPFSVGELPFGIDFATAYRAVPQPRPLVALLGVAGDDAAPVLCEFANSHVYKVVGPPGSGRSTVLATMAVSLLDAGTGLVVIAPRESPLRRLAGDPKVRLLTSAAASAQEVRDALDGLGTPCVVLVDDAELLSQMPPCDAALREVIATGRDRGIGLALSTVAETFSQGSVGWLKDARTVRRGVLLAPQAMLEGDIIGTRVPANLLRRPARPGRGYIADPRTGATVSIALPLTVLREPGGESQ